MTKKNSKTVYKNWFEKKWRRSDHVKFAFPFKEKQTFKSFTNQTWVYNHHLINYVLIWIHCGSEAFPSFKNKNKRLLVKIREDR